MSEATTAAPRPEPEVLDGLVSFDEDYSDSTAGTRLVIQRTQEIPDDYISQLKRDKIDSLHTPMGDFYRVATIPIEVVHEMDRQGMRIEEMSVHEILAYLNKHSLDAFITTNKRF